MNISIKILLIFSLLALFNNNVFSQCDEKLVDEAINKNGMDALFIREFKLQQGYSKKDLRKKRNKNKSKSSRSSITRAVAISKYNIRLHSGMQYRFNILNNEESQTKGILQLRKNNDILGSTYDIENQKDNEQFDYYCKEGSQYQVILSFLDGNIGCTVGVMSVVINDSTVAEALMDSTQTNKILYSGSDNYVDIASTTNPNGELEVSISRGEIEKEGGLYRINVDDEGPVQVFVTAIDSLGEVSESFESEFHVMEKKMPSISFLGSMGGIISKATILNSMPYLAISNWQWKNSYRLKMFTLAKNLTLSGISAINTNTMTSRQLKEIKELKVGDTFYIKDIIVEDKKGQVYNLPPLGFILTE